jgi:DNA-binding transcriptional regulator LsrR (DeoR family)
VAAARRPRAPVRILTSGGEEKIGALMGAMNLIRPTVLITDEESARRMLAERADTAAGQLTR